MNEKCQKTRVAAIIPARYASTRFPGKPLVPIGGVSMIERVYRQASQAQLLDEVIVATDDHRIFDAVSGFGGTVVLTRDDHINGTDRLAEVAAARPDLDIIVNVQGDEPLIDPGNIDAAVGPLLDAPDISMSTLCAPIKSEEEFLNPNVVKVVLDKNGFALYFSRSPIPHDRDQLGFNQTKHWGHLGLYVYRRQTLLSISQLPSTPLEEIEKLEQLRALENGIRIMVVPVAHRSLAVDRPEDVEAVEKALLAV